MLNWCSYCQQFMGEDPPYEDFSISHGLCATCAADGDALLERDLSHALTLKGIQDRLFEAGWRGDLDEVERIIEDSRAENVRDVDFLIGLVAPMLYQIGEDWKRCAITVADEHRFTSFCERVFEIIAPEITSAAPAVVARTEPVEALVINAPENRHMLGIRIVALWLVSKGVRAHAVDRPLNVEDILALVRTRQPRYLLVSVALAEQRESVVAIAERIAALPARTRPKIIVGGNAVKLGFVRDIPNCDLIADLGSLILATAEQNAPH